MEIRPMPEPFFKITPGQHLRFTLEDENMTPEQLAARAGIPADRFRAILEDRIAPTDADAVAMSRVWNQSENFWRGLFGLPKVAQRKADKNVMFWTTAEKKEQIRACAAAHNLSISAFILQAVNAAIEADDTQPPPPRLVALATDKDLAAAP